jgi:hypothetical protein
MNRYIKGFATFPELVQRVAVTDDKELAVKIKIVEKYGDRMPEYVEIIR